MSSFDARPTSNPSTRLARALRRGSLVLAAGAGAAVLAGCSAGQITATAQTKTAVQGADARSGSIYLQNLTVVFRGEANRVYAAGENAPLVVRIVNSGHGADTLTSVSTSVADDVVFIDRKAATSVSPTPQGSASAGSPQPTGTASPAGAPSPAPQEGQRQFRLTVRPDQFTALLPDEGQFLQVDGLHRELQPGQSVHLVFHFEHAGPIAVNVPMAVPDQITTRTTAPELEPSTAD